MLAHFNVSQNQYKYQTKFNTITSFTLVLKIVVAIAVGRDVCSVTNSKNIFSKCNLEYLKKKTTKYNFEFTWYDTIEIIKGSTFIIKLPALLQQKKERLSYLKTTHKLFKVK